MNTENQDNYKYILETFGSEVIESRANWLKELMDSYIQHENLSDTVYISEPIFFHVIIDYFADIERLKEFHKITKTNITKIYSYLTYWILKHKPIQVNSNITEKYIFINENFCAELLRCFLFDNPADIPIKQESSESINDFIRTLLYYFKYRDFTAKSIELVLTAFNAGRGYQFSVDFQN